MSHTHKLMGCRPEPLGSYLKGLGVLRLIGQQVDPTTTGYWSNTGFVLESVLDWDELIDFFLDVYQPTPMVSPWNKGAGYRGDGKSKSAEERVAEALASTANRLSPMRQAIAVSKSLSDRYPADKDFVAAKDMIITQARSLLPDLALDWIDAAVVLTEGGPVYPHLLGTGGNLGRLDLTANLLSHLDAIIGLADPADRPRSRAWLIDAFKGSDLARRLKSSAGQYEPGNAGGINSSTLDGGDPLVNPWSFVLQLEGAVLFASGLARRLGTDQNSVAAMPFTVRPTTSGSGHLSSEENSKGELWLPLWSTPSTAREVRRLFAEARLRWSGSAAATGLDAARAIATLGTDRGIPAFSRSVIAERLGQSTLAVPAGRVAVGRRRAVSLTSHLDRWLDRVRRHSSHPVINQGRHRINESIMGLTRDQEGNTAGAQDLLLAVADVDTAISRNKTLRKDLPPAPQLNAAEWLPLLDDGSAEFAVAWGFASLHEARDDPRRSRDGYRSSWRPTLRDYLRGTQARRTGTELTWSDGPGNPIDASRRIADAIAAVHVTHAINPREIEGTSGAITTMRHGSWVDAGCVEAFAAGVLDDQRIGHLLRALVILDIESPWASASPSLSGRRPPPAAIPIWRFVAPLFDGTAEFPETRNGDQGLTADGAWPSLLTRGSTAEFLRQAVARYRTQVGPIREFDPQRLARGAAGPQLTAALLLHLSSGTRQRLLARLVAPSNGDHDPSLESGKESR